MNRKQFHLQLLLLANCLALPALARSHAIDVWARLELEQRLVPGASISVYRGPGVPDDLLHKEIAAKIESLLVEKGFVLTSDDEAAFHVLFDYGTAEHAHAKPLGGYRTGVALERSQRAYEYTHYFTTFVADAAVFRETGETRIVWQGKAILADRVTKNPGGKSDERAVAILDVLRVAAFEYFGETVDWTLKYYKVPKVGKKSEC